MRKLKAGDRVLIINSSNPDYIGREGRIKWINEEEQLMHGTWGSEPINMVTDEYTAVSKKSFF